MQLFGANGGQSAWRLASRSLTRLDTVLDFEANFAFRTALTPWRNLLLLRYIYLTQSWVEAHFRTLRPVVLDSGGMDSVCFQAALFRSSDHSINIVERPRSRSLRRTSELKSATFLHLCGRNSIGLHHKRFNPRRYSAEQDLKKCQIPQVGARSPFALPRTSTVHVRFCHCPRIFYFTLQPEK